MSQPLSATADGDEAPVHLDRPAPAIIAALFCGYLCIGLPLPVIPLFVHDSLGYGNLVVGLTIGVQFLATVLTRGYAGRVTDMQGGKRSALQGAAACAFGGLLYLIAATPSFDSALSLPLLVIGRLAVGLGESQFVTGCVSWSIASVGPQRAGMSMSWTGIAMFAALAVGSPIGMRLFQSHGFLAVTIACIATPLLAAAIALGAKSYTSAAGARLAFRRVVGQIWREGLGLMLSGVGLAVLSAFASLFFASKGWSHAGFVMTCFGAGFILVRLLFGHLPDRIGGYRVAVVSLLVEAVGQALIWAAPNESVALLGGLVTGLGCALVFPALGVEALKRVPPASRGSAMGAFVAFLDIAYGLSGPAAGVVSGMFGYAAVYVLGGVAAFLGSLVAWRAKARN
ncbi:arabinose transporter [Rhizobium sp. BK251]|uniref:arabinose transporter n=1 Tax=Rhizobium sp. BK251 TaxID=2512125 RepID=UPI001046015B|nr:arabinose transporter [Rhizobium sp. BK251]TCL68297.1 putative MFS family arabinose efflux permease [Rhizobium sp. BK251]